MMTDETYARSLPAMGDPDLITEQATVHVIMLYGLSLATGLPPAAILAPPGAVRPTARSAPDTILRTWELAATLNRPIVEAWCGRVALDEIDARLRGLESHLYVFQVTDGSGALVCLSAVRSDRTAGRARSASPVGLWSLACQALRRFGIPHQRLTGVGEDAFLATYGGVTAQAAWLAGERMMTASVTCLAGDQESAAEAARSIAVSLDRAPSGRLLGA